MFQVGDAVMHPANGAGIVTGLQRLGNHEDGSQYYKIEIVGGRTKTFVMVPVQQAESLGIRNVIPEVRLKKVWRVLQSNPNVLPSAHKKRYKVLEKKLETQDVLKFAEVVRDLEWRKLQEDKLNVPGKRIYDRALRFLVGELALSQGIDLEDAEVQVRSMVTENLSTRSDEDLN